MTYHASPSKLLRFFPALSTAVLWPLVLLAGLVFFVSLVPSPPNDLWWYLRIGYLIDTEHALPQSNYFSWTLPADAPYVYGTWLGQFLMYWFYRVGRLETLIFIRNLIAALTFWGVVLETRRTTNSWRWGAVAVALSASMMLNNAIVRPQMWAWLPFGIYALILSRYAEGQLRPAWLLVLPAVMVFWVNVHGSFMLGGIFIALYTLGETLRTLSGAYKLEARSWKAIGWLVGSGALTGAAMFITPLGLGILNYVYDLLTDQPSQALVSEWQSPAPAGFVNVVFYLSIVLFLGLLSFKTRRLRPTEQLIVLFFVWLAWTGQRYVLWYGLACMPLLVRQLQSLPWPAFHWPPQHNRLNTVFAALMFVPVALAQPWTVHLLPLPERYQATVLQPPASDLAGPLLTAATPVLAVEYLKAHPGGKLFNDMGYGSYLLWAMPEQGVFVDARVELYPYAQWQDYIRISLGARYNELLAQYGADRLFLDKQLQSELIAALQHDPRWILEYEDTRSQLWKQAP